MKVAASAARTTNQMADLRNDPDEGERYFKGVSEIDDLRHAATHSAIVCTL
jgi:hypothetical protein